MNFDTIEEILMSIEVGNRDQLSSIIATIHEIKKSEFDFLKKCNYFRSYLVSPQLRKSARFHSILVKKKLLKNDLFPYPTLTVASLCEF